MRLMQANRGDILLVGFDAKYAAEQLKLKFRQLLNK